MVFHTAHLEVREDAVEQFRARLLRHAKTTLDAEPGCRRFDIHQEKSDPTLFLLIEIYTDDAALETHRASPHYMQFRQDVKDWVTGRTWWYWQKLDSPVG
jgi:quinol monooxygenase YgiN